MPFWKSSTISPSSSSSPKSTPSSPSKQKFFVWNRKESHQHQQESHTHSEQQSRRNPCLTRQRKLRHLTDADIRDLSLNPRRTSSALGDSTALPSSPTSRSSTSARMSSVVPLPLPPPDLSTALRSGASGLSSPINADRSGDRATSVPSTWGKFAHQSVSKGMEHVSKGMEHVEVAPGVSTLGHRKKLQDPGVAENIQKAFRISVSADSAPTSGISSPILSPRGLSSADFFPSSYISNKCLPWSDPEYHSPDMTFSPRTSPEKFFPSPDLSPLHSPGMKSPARKSNNPSGASTPLHPRMSLEGAAAAWHDSNGNVAVHPHPLPRPPVAMAHSQPSYVHQATEKSEVPSRINQWQKGKLIGSGTFGNVYVATNRETGASCAMKEVNLIPGDSKSAESIKQLEQEIRVLSHLKHPNIVQYYGSGIVEDRFYIFLEYVHPGSISKYVRDNFGAMTESVVRNFTRHILYGLAYLHSTKTIHRDIKGANLLVDASGVVKLADFGMAKHLSGPAAAQSLRGSPYWMAPEVMHAMMQKDSGYDVAVDIWSLGCTIIEMLTGKPPWSEYEGAAAMFKVMKNESPPIPDALSPEGKNFLHCCLQRNPVERPSAMQLLDHPFIKNSINQEILGAKLMDNMVLPSPRDRTSFMPLSPTRAASYQLPNVQTGQSYHETSESAVASRHSPRSILEAIPSLSPPRSNHSSHASFSTKANVLNGFCLGATSNHT